MTKREVISEVEGHQIENPPMMVDPQMMVDPLIMVDPLMMVDPLTMDGPPAMMEDPLMMEDPQEMEDLQDDLEDEDHQAHKDLLDQCRPIIVQQPQVTLDTTALENTFGTVGQSMLQLARAQDQRNRHLQQHLQQGQMNMQAHTGALQQLATYTYQ